MATLNDALTQVLKWIDEDFKFASSNNNVEVVDEDKIRLYTNENCYAIVARGGERSYLGCISSSRKPRAGEDWTRGSDLADGDFSKETWHRIISDIVSYELVKVHN